VTAAESPAGAVTAGAGRVLAMVDGVGIPLALGDPAITAAGATAEVLAALEQLVALR
jgi:hypothetical protein